MLMVACWTGLRRIRFRFFKAFFGPASRWWPKADDRYAELSVPRGWRIFTQLFLPPIPLRYLPERRPWMRYLPSAWFLREPFLEKCPYADNEGGRAGERWVFINGAMTTDPVLDLNIRYIQELFGTDLLLIRTPCNGVFLDLAEVALPGWFGHMANSVGLVRETLVSLLREEDVRRVVVLAHSKGTIVVAKACEEMMASWEGPARKGPARGGPARKGPEADLTKLEVYALSDCARQWPYLENGNSPIYQEHLVNQFDAPAGVGMLDSRTHPPGRVFIRPAVWGHLLNMHYLSALDPGHPCYQEDAFAGSRLRGEVRARD